MITIRPSGERGRADLGWLDSRFTFSFADYHDPAHMGFRSLRVINEDVVAPGTGFDPHPHRDMEIVTYVLSGSLEHRDSMGNGSVLRAGDVQRMTAGTGVVHSERNPSADEALHLLQIWIRPGTHGLRPGWEERNFPVAEKRGRLRLLVSPDGADGSLRIHQDARILAGVLDRGEAVRHALAAGRHAWVQVAGGEVVLDGRRLAAGDGASADSAEALRIEARAPSEVLVFDLA